MKEECKQYVEHFLKGQKENPIGDEHVFLFQGELMCDALACKNNKGKYLIEDFLAGYCISKDIENGIPVDKNGKEIDFGKLEKSVENVNFSGAQVYKDVKPMNPKTGNTKPYED